MICKKSNVFLDHFKTHLLNPLQKEIFNGIRNYIVLKVEG